MMHAGSCRSLFNEPHSPGTALMEMGLEGDTKLWIGKDYTNFIVKDFVDLEEPFTGRVFSKRNLNVMLV